MSKRTKSSPRSRSKTAEAPAEKSAWRDASDTIPRELTRSFWHNVQQRILEEGHSIKAVKKAVREYQDALGERSMLFAYEQGEARAAEAISARLKHAPTNS